MNRNGVGRCDLAAATGLAAWLALVCVPAWLGARIGNVPATGLTLVALLAMLLATRRACGAASGAWRIAAWRRTLGAGALAAIAGALAAPLLVRAVLTIGSGLHLSPVAPQPSRMEPAVGLCAVVLGPSVEELLYRERLMLALRPWGPLVAAGAPALLFALAHPGPWTRLAAGVCGVCLGAAMWRTGSLALCIGAHAGLNAVVLAFGTPARVGAGVAVLLGATALGLFVLSARIARGERVRRAAGGALLLGSLVAAPAAADVQAFDARLVLDALAPAISPLVLPGAGVATVNGSGGGVGLQTLALAGGVAGTAIVPITDPLVSNGGLVEMALSASLGSGTLRPFQPPASYPAVQLTQATLPLAGEQRLCLLFTGCAVPFGMPLQRGTGTSAVGVGVGGLLTAYPLSTVMLSLLGAPWTVRSASLPVTTSQGASFFAVDAGFAHGPASFTGSTAATGGALRLVTPVRIDATGGLGSPSGFARLEIRFLPEPRSLLLLGPGLACLAIAVRLRRA